MPCLSLWCRHWSAVAPHYLARDPWDLMHVANCDCHVFLYSLAHWHVSALSPIRKLSSPPHRRHRQRHFQADSADAAAAAAVGTPDCCSCSCRQCCRRRCSDSVWDGENLCRRKNCLCKRKLICLPTLAYRFLRTICYRPAKQFCAILNRHFS